MRAPDESSDAYALAAPVEPAGSYSAVVRDGQRLYVSGQVPWRDGALLATGRLGAELTVEQGRACARQCAANSLAALAGELGPAGLSTVESVLFARVFIASVPGFTQHVAVADGATDLLISVLGAGGRPARSAVGVTTLPLDAPVELELIVRITNL